MVAPAAAPVATALTTKASAATVAQYGAATGGTASSLGVASVPGGVGNAAVTTAGAGGYGWTTATGAGGWAGTMFGGRPAAQPAAAENGPLGGGMFKITEHVLGAAGPLMKGAAIAAAQKAEQAFLRRSARAAEVAATERAGSRFRALNGAVSANAARALSNDMDIASASLQAKNAASAATVTRANNDDNLRAALIKAQLEAQADAIDPSATRLASYLGAIKVGLAGPYA